MIGRAVRRLPEVLLHPLRRRRTERRLREGRRPASVLFLCLGNVCRSPYAARAFRREMEAGPAVRAASAGFGAWDRRPPSEAVAEAASRGIDLAGHRSRPVAYDLVDSTELFVVTAARQGRRLRHRFGVPPDAIVHLGDLDPARLGGRTIEDPWGGTREAYRRSYDRIDRCVARLAEILAGPPGPAD